MIVSYCTNYSCFARPYRQTLSRGKPRGETEEEGGVLEYDSPSSSKDSEEESLANNNNHETDNDVSSEIPSLDDFTVRKDYSMTEIYFNCCKRVLKGSLNLLSQPFFRLNPSPSNEIEKKSQSRLFIVTLNFSQSSSFHSFFFFFFFLAIELNVQLLLSL